MDGAEPQTWEKTRVIVSLSEQSLRMKQKQARMLGYSLRSKEGEQGPRKLKVAWSLTQSH